MSKGHYNPEWNYEYSRRPEVVERRKARCLYRYHNDEEYHQRRLLAAKKVNIKRREEFMKYCITKEQADRLDAVGVNANKCNHIGTLLDAFCNPSEGESLNIRTRSLEKDYELYYSNAGDARYSDTDKDLIELLVRFGEWKTPKWRINEKYYKDGR